MLQSQGGNSARSRLSKLGGAVGALLLLTSGLAVGTTVPGVPIASAASEPAGSFIRGTNVFYAYVGAGENLDVAFAKIAAGGPDVTITIRGPGGEVVNCTVAGADATGAGCFQNNLTSTTPGLWEITFGVATPPSVFFTWDIDVQAGVTTLPGRVYTENYNMRTQGEIDITFWYQSENGYLYEATYNDYHGVDSQFQSDAVGNVVNGTCVSAYESIDAGGPFSDLDRFTFWPGDCGDVYKIFFEPPDPLMPDTALLPGGGTTWLTPPILPPDVANLVFTQDPNTLTRSGQFTFDSINFVGGASLQIDANNDGDYDDPEDRTVPIGIAADGSQTVAFDGLDGLGNPIPVTTAIQARVLIDRTGEIHFTNADVELRTGGLAVTKLNGPDIGSSTLYWNDTNLLTTDRTCTTPVLDGRSGLSSAGGVHGWGPCPLSNANNGIHGSWGDVRVIDDWTYHSIFEETTVAIPAVATVTQTKMLDGAPVFDPATGTWTIEYVITETAAGSGSTTYTLDDDLIYGANMVIDSAVMTADAVGTPAPSASWNGESDLRVVTAVPITAGETHVYRATVVTHLTAPQGGTFGECIAGEDFFNSATLTPTNGVVEVDDACGEPTSPTVVLDKEVVSSTYDPTTLEYTVTYNVSATATGVGQTFYNATDALNYGPSIDVTAVIAANPGAPAPDPTWDGEGATTIVTNQPIVGGEIHRWTVTATAVLIAPPTGAADTCTAGSDFYNQATLTIVGETVTQTDEECVPVVTPTVTHDKRLLGATFDNGTGEWTIDYAIDVVATGEGTGFYDLDDQFFFGPTITIVGTAALTAPAGVAPIGGWTGLDPNVEIVNAQPIGGGVTHTYFVTVVATVNDPPAPGACAENEDFYNRSTLTTGGEITTDEACVEPEQPALAHDKTADAVTFDAATDEYVVTYTINVAATGTGNRAYDLLDTLDFPPNMAITGAQVTSAPVGVTTRPEWNGGINPLIATAVNIVAGETHTYSIEVRAQLTGPDAVSNDPGVCSLGLDFVNRSQVVAAADVLDDNDCIERPQPPVTPTKTLTDVALDPATGVYTLTYTITAVAGEVPAGQTFYDLSDEFDFGPMVNVVSATASSADATVVPGWNGQDPTALLVDDQLITSGDTDTITVVVGVTITETLAGNDPTLCSAGMDLHNDATLTAGGLDPVVDSECAELPAVAHDKIVESGPTPVPGQPGRYSITYLLTETETVNGPLPAAYDLTDELRYGPDAGVVSVEPVVTMPAPLTGLQAGWTGQGANTLLVDNGVLAPGETQTIRITVIVDSLLPDPADADGVPCSTLDEDLANTSTLTSNGAVIVDDACAPLPHPSIDHTKTITGITPNGDGTYTVGYRVVATNNGDGAGTYDLADTLRYGTGVEIVGQPTVTASPSAVSLLAGWNGTTSTGLVNDQPIGPAAVHTYTLTVVVRPDPDTTIGSATDCTLQGGESGTGVRNESTLTSTAGTQTRDACGELPHFVVTKAITSEPTDAGNGQYTVGYTVTVTNDGAGAGAYDLTDQLTYGANVTIVSATIDNTAPGGIATNADWNGRTDTSVTNDVNLSPNSSHTYGVTVTFSVPAGSTGAQNDCSLDPGESGTGLLNTATVDSNGNKQAAVACAQVTPPSQPPPPSTTVPPPSTPVPPTPPIGELPGTGGNNTALAQIALLLVVIGAAVLVATRRRPRANTIGGTTIQ